MKTQRQSHSVQDGLRNPREALHPQYTCTPQLKAHSLIIRVHIVQEALTPLTQLPRSQPLLRQFGLGPFISNRASRYPKALSPVSTINSDDCSCSYNSTAALLFQTRQHGGSPGLNTAFLPVQQIVTHGATLSSSSLEDCRVDPRIPQQSLGHHRNCQLQGEH